MALQICSVSFTGELPSGSMKTFYEGRDVLDPSKPDEAALLKLWGEFFKPVASTHSYAPEPEKRARLTEES